jgi:hypothetical protein
MERNMKNTIHIVVMLLLTFSLFTFGQPSQDTLLRIIKSIAKQQQQNYVKIHNKDLYRYEIMPLAFTPMDTTLPSLTMGQIICYDNYGGIVWTNYNKKDTIKIGDSAYAILKTWLLTKPDTTYRVLWFRVNLRRQWFWLNR